MPTERLVNADGRVDADQGWSMPTRRLVDAYGRVDADQKAGRCRRKGRCRPEGWSMPTQVGRCRPERSMLRRIPTRSEKPERQQSELRKESEFRKSPKHKVGGPTRPENTKTPKSRNFRPVRKHRKFDSSGRCPESLTSAPTRKRTEPDEQTRPSAVTKVSRRPMQNRTPERMTSREPEGATANAGKAWSREGPEPKSRRARGASS
jgi:hypothetical protein